MARAPVAGTARASASSMAGKTAGELLGGIANGPPATEPDEYRPT